jgi:IS30 family transposase
MGNPYNQLTLIQRYKIQAFKEINYSARQIAKKIKCSNKTVSNELKRCPNENYCAVVAHNHALMKRHNAAKAHKRTPEVIRKTRILLDLKMSPEQISGRMKLESSCELISRQTIYRLVAQEKWRGLLARKGKRYRKRKGVSAGAHLIPNRVDIDERPACVDLKEEVGHWEGDTVYGQNSYLVTLTERVSKMLLTVRVKNKTKKAVARAIKKMLKPFKDICKTITFDNGGEFAAHESISRALDCKIYFAKPYHSWQRGCNENLDSQHNRHT